MLIDFEAHYCLDDTFSLRALVNRDNHDETAGDAPGGPPAGPLENLTLSRIDVRLADMDRCGIDMQVLSHSAGIEALEPETAVAVARRVNDAVHEVMQRHPGRFLGWAALPVRAPEAAAEELRRCVQQLGFLGWNVYSYFVIRQRIDDTMFAPILEEADRLAIPVYIHPTAPNMAEYQGGPPALWGGLGYAADTMLTVVKMQLAGVFDRCPNIRFVLGHLGEGFPFVAKRMGGDPARSGGQCAHGIDYYLRNNFYVTTSGQFDPAAFACTRSVMGAERILFGSDYPMERAASGVEFLRSLPLSVEQRRGIAAENGIRAFGMQL